MSTLLQQLNLEMSTTVENIRRSLVKISNGRHGAGAGTLWHPDGLIITNAHVVQRGPINVILPDGRTLPARRLASDEARDVAALAIDATGLPTIELGNSKQLQPGDWVLALGHPWGVSGAVTAGMVIDVGQPLEISAFKREMIQIGLHLRPGHSGGPLVDADGRLVGINTMMAGPDVGLAVPVHVVKNFLHHHLDSKAKSEETYI
jgi:serine protease Do